MVSVDVGVWRKLRKLRQKMGQPGDIELGCYCRAGWGVEGWVVHLAGTPLFATVQVGPDQRQIIEAKYLFRANPEHAVAWLDVREEDNAP